MEAAAARGHGRVVMLLGEFLEALHASRVLRAGGGDVLVVDRRVTRRVIAAQRLERALHGIHMGTARADDLLSRAGVLAFDRRGLLEGVQLIGGLAHRLLGAGDGVRVHRARLLGRAIGAGQGRARARHVLVGVVDQHGARGHHVNALGSAACCTQLGHAQGGAKQDHQSEDHQGGQQAMANTEVVHGAGCSLDRWSTDQA
ncbi:hypothetical protein D3C81_1115730 [compost metagenome]